MNRSANLDEPNTTQNITNKSFRINRSTCFRHFSSFTHQLIKSTISDSLHSANASQGSLILLKSIDNGWSCSLNFIFLQKRAIPAVSQLVNRPASSKTYGRKHDDSKDWEELMMLSSLSEYEYITKLGTIQNRNGSEDIHTISTFGYTVLWVSK